jgi:AcrR family transcriptional regulator
VAKKKKTPRKTAKKRPGRPPKNTGPSEALPRILTVARKHFATFGLQGSNLKDIAAEAKVANSLITYHFGGKDGLFQACLMSPVKMRVEEINRLLEDPQTLEELKVRLQIFVEELILNHLKDPDIFETLQREVRADNPMAIRFFEETFLKCFYNVTEFFSRAKKRGLLSKTADPLMVSLLLFSITCDHAEKDHLAQKYMGKSLQDASWRKHMTTQIVELFMNGVTK